MDTAEAMKRTQRIGCGSRPRERAREETPPPSFLSRRRSSLRSASPTKKPGAAQPFLPPPPHEPVPSLRARSGAGFASRKIEMGQCERLQRGKLGSKGDLLEKNLRAMTNEEKKNIKSLTSSFSPFAPDPLQLGAGDCEALADLCKKGDGRGPGEPRSGGG